MRSAPTQVCLEVGSRRTFAWALEWPGWCRSGRGEAAAVEALAAVAPRYEPVAAMADVPFDLASIVAFEIIERLPGSAGTDFGVPSALAAADGAEVSAADGARLAALLDASWRVFDRVAGSAPPVLRKGPRGGGRDRDAIVAHVRQAEVDYARKIALRIPRGDTLATNPAGELRAAILRAIRAGSGGNTAETPWPLRYAARRIAWHVLDHAWEIEDRATVDVPTS